MTVTRSLVTVTHLIGDCHPLNQDADNEAMSKVVKWLIPSLFILVVGSQIFLSEALYLSPWRGGGFGMFATVDRYDRRRIMGLGQDALGNQYRILNIRDKTLEAMPTPEGLKRLAVNLRKLEYLPARESERSKLQKLLTPAQGELIYFEKPTEEPMKFLRKKPSQSRLPGIRLVEVEVSTWLRVHDPKTLKFYWRQVGIAVNSEDLS